MMSNYQNQGTSNIRSPVRKSTMHQNIKKSIRKPVIDEDALYDREKERKIMIAKELKDQEE